MRPVCAAGLLASEATAFKTQSEQKDFSTFNAP